MIKANNTVELTVTTPIGLVADGGTWGGVVTVVHL